jgi:hypothetical protein
MFDEEHSIITSKYNTEYISKLILELFKIIHGNWLKDNNGNLEFDENILSMTHELEQSLEDVINGIIIRKSILTRYRLSP